MQLYHERGADMPGITRYAIVSALVFVLWRPIYQFAIAPFKIWRKHRTSSIFTWQRTAVENLSTEMREFLGRVMRDFRSEGFEVAANLRRSNTALNVESFQVLLVNRASNDLAVSIMTRGAVGTKLVFVIRSEFENGMRVSTGANPGIGLLPDSPTEDYQNFPWVTDARVLCEAHRRRLEHAGNSQAQRVAPVPGAEIAYYNQDSERGHKRFVECGYWHYDEPVKEFRYTLVGAFICTWKLVEPIKGMRMWLRNRKAKIAWNELGMDAVRVVDLTPASR